MVTRVPIFSSDVLRWDGHVMYRNIHS